MKNSRETDLTIGEKSTNAKANKRKRVLLLRNEKA